ncbi:MAG: Nif3-like dinuclear metal center hexameric protein [Prevotella sp.]
MYSVKIQEVIDALELFAPLPLQESYDNAGLQVGLTEADISGALLCLDVTEDVVDDAIRRGCNLIVAHHPLIFRGLKTVSDADYVQRAVWKAIRHDVCIVAMHTNLDNANGGVNHEIATVMGMGDVTFLSGQHTIQDPKGGQTPESQLTGGSGVIGRLPQETDAETFIQDVKRIFGAACCMTNEPLRRKIRTVALCGGAGSFLLPEAIRHKADAFITGEMGYHDFFGHDQEIQIMVIGHYETEQFTVRIFRRIISALCPSLPVYDYGPTNPIRYW